MKVFVVIHKKTQRIVPEAGISFNKGEIEPKPAYREEYCLGEFELPAEVGETSGKLLKYI